MKILYIFKNGSLHCKRLGRYVEISWKRQRNLEWMLAEERIKNWGENLGDEEGARKRNLNFGEKMNFPFYKKN